jgi:S-adenosyl-L-methionine hydrolase (adenosine-forming)
MKPNGIITLITDFGMSDPYVAMMKGVILSINPAAIVVDVTHQIGSGFITQAARIISETFPFFPRSTVHVAVVDPGVGTARRLIALSAEGHFFVGPDNGIFWPVMERRGAEKIIHLTESRFFLPYTSHTFHGRDVFAPVAGHISLGVGLEEMGTTITDPTPLSLPLPYSKENILYGQVIHVDNFGNLVTNIGDDELRKFLESGRPHIHVGRLLVYGLNDIYADVDRGQPLALINSSRLLEIAVNMGRACEYVGVPNENIVGTTVMVRKS